MMIGKIKRHLALAGVGVSFILGQSFGGGEMIAYLLYGLHPKTTRFESVYKQNPMNNNRVLCGFHPHFGYGGVNLCNSSGASVAVNRMHARAKFGQGGGR